MSQNIGDYKNKNMVPAPKKIEHIKNTQKIIKGMRINHNSILIPCTTTFQQ